jgi:hypothetical protein
LITIVLFLGSDLGSECRSSWANADGRHLKVKKAFKTNIMEDEGEELGVIEGMRSGKKVFDVEVVLRPFEVVTLRLEF